MNAGERQTNLKLAPRQGHEPVTVRNHVTNPFPFSIRTFCYRALSHLGARVQALDAVPFSLKHSYYLTAFRYSLSYLHVIDWT